MVFSLGGNSAHSGVDFVPPASVAQTHAELPPSPGASHALVAMSGKSDIDFYTTVVCCTSHALTAAHSGRKSDVGVNETSVKEGLKCCR
jgi:hypothetical protein